MSTWNNRPIEIANLFNPAFCSALIQHSLRGYQSVREIGMPFALSYLVLPIILHEKTRNRLPKDTRTQMHVWLQSNPDVRINFIQRAQNLVPYTKEALIFGMNTEIFTIQDNGHIVWIKRNLRMPSGDSELLKLLRRSDFIGKWFAQFSEPSSVFTMWGVRP